MQHPGKIRKVEMRQAGRAKRAPCLFPASQQPPALRRNEREWLRLPTCPGCIPEDEGPGEPLLFASQGQRCPAGERWQWLSPTGICCIPKHRSQQKMQVSSSNTSPHQLRDLNTGTHPRISKTENITLNAPNRNTSDDFLLAHILQPALRAGRGCLLLWLLLAVFPLLPSKQRPLFL